MTKREAFFNVKTYKEFDERREEFRGMPVDKEMLQHVSKLFGKSPNPREELYRTTPYQQCQDCQNWRGFDGCKLYPSILKEKPKLSDGIPCSYHITKASLSEIKK